jgi:hypothetical protein
MVEFDVKSEMSKMSEIREGGEERGGREEERGEEPALFSHLINLT